jgi:hypothetical protein
LRIKTQSSAGPLNEQSLFDSQESIAIGDRFVHKADSWDKAIKREITKETYVWNTQGAQRTSALGSFAQEMELSRREVVTSIGSCAC